MGSPERNVAFQPWRNVPPSVATSFRPYLPRLAEVAVAEIQRQVPEYARPADPKYVEVLRMAVEGALGHFFDLIADPDAPWDEVLEFFRDIGYGEAKEGRSLDVWEVALRLGARLAVRTLGEESLRLEIPKQTLGQLAEAVFAYLEVIAKAASRGYAEASVRVAGELQHRRRRLLEILLVEPLAPQAVQELARLAQWQVPRTLCVVTLHERREGGYRPPVLPPDVLVDVDRGEPCAIVPDPDGPGRRPLLTGALRDWIAAVGPTVDVSGTAGSLRWAREALALAIRGILPDDGLVVATDHMPAMVIMRNEELVSAVAADRLAPLSQVRPTQRGRLARTLLECLRCGFNATEVAGRLRVHPQTVRYRLHQLEELFGDQLYDPSRRLEYEMALHAWLARSPATGRAGPDPDPEPDGDEDAKVIPLSPGR